MMQELNDPTMRASTSNGGRSRRGSADNGQPDNLHVITENGEQCFMWNANQLTYIAQDRHELPAIFATKFGHLATRLDLSYNSLTSFKGINLFTCLNELILDNNEFEDDHLEFRKNLRLKTLSLNKNKLANLYKLINSIKSCFPNLEYLSLIGNPLCPGPILNGVSKRKELDCGEDQPEVASRSSTRRESPLPDTTTTILSGGMRIDELVLNERALDQAAAAASGATRELTTSKNAEFNLKKYRHFIIYHLPNLRFLDSSPITASERDDALRRCFWMSQATLNRLNHNGAERMDGLAASETIINNGHLRQSDSVRQFARSEKGLVAGSNGDVETPQLTIMTENNNDLQPKGIFSRLTYKYTGRNSEGNRFIRNQDL